MKNFLEASTIEGICHARIRLVVITDAGFPKFTVRFNQQVVFDDLLKQSEDIKFSFSTREIFNVEFLLQGKKYLQHKETAVIIKKFVVDGLEILPRFNYHFQYINDHEKNIITNYMGFNGTLSLSSQDNFHMWYHKASDQGMLLIP